MSTALALLLALPALIWDGFVARTMWGWFAVPMGAPPISLEAASGLALLLSFITVQIPREKPDPEREVDSLARLIIGVIFGLIVLVFGALIRIVL